MLPVNSRSYINRQHPRMYSATTPLSEIHAQLKDVEDMFAKYRLDLIEDAAEIDKLEQAGNIPKVTADILKSEIKHRQEASSIMPII